MQKSTQLLAALAGLLSLGYAWSFSSGFLGFVAYVSAGGGVSARNAVLSCREYYNNRPDVPFVTKLDCVGDAIGFMLKSVGAFVAGSTAEEAIRARYLGATANGNQGRDVVNLVEFNDEINSHPDFVDSDHPVTVESVSSSDVGIEDAVAYTVSMGNYTDVIEYHTNGTHSLSWLGDTAANTQKRSLLDTSARFFGFGGTIQGLKVTTYIGNRDSRVAQEQDDLFKIGKKFVTSGEYQKSDSWTWAVCEGNTGFAYGRIITEYNGFGDNYEGVSPPPRCH